MNLIVNNVNLLCLFSYLVLLNAYFLGYFVALYNDKAAGAQRSSRLYIGLSA